MGRFTGSLAFLAVAYLAAVSARVLLQDEPVSGNDALPGITLPTRSQVTSFVESQPVQAMLSSAAAMAPAIGAGLAPLSQPAFVLAPARAPGALPGVVPNGAVLPMPLPATETTPTRTEVEGVSFQEQQATPGVEVIQDGPLRGAIVSDDAAGNAGTDPATVRPPLDPRFLRFGPVPGPVPQTTSFAERFAGAPAPMGGLPVMPEVGPQTGPVGPRLPGPGPLAAPGPLPPLASTETAAAMRPEVQPAGETATPAAPASSTRTIATEAELAQAPADWKFCWMENGKEVCCLNNGEGNRGCNNTGSGNVGDNNVGNGNWGSGNYGNGNLNENGTPANNNHGDGNHGSDNWGNGNSGDANAGQGNSGSHNGGVTNTGSWNRGNNNSGSYNMGSNNEASNVSGDNIKTTEATMTAGK